MKEPAQQRALSFGAAGDRSPCFVQYQNQAHPDGIAPELLHPGGTAAATNAEVSAKPHESFSTSTWSNDMARLPSALKRKEGAANRAIELRRENLDRLNAGQAPRPVPEAEGAAAGPVQQQAAPEPAELERLRSRLSTSEGMLRAEGERNRQLQQEARAREQALQARIQALERQQPAAAMPVDELRRYVTERQLEEFGAEHCRMIVSAARAAGGELSRGAVQEEVASLRSELAEQRTAVRRSQEAAFWSSINAALPRWRETNADARFLNWLGERDTMAGRTRQEVLNEAQQALDAERVIAIFNTWMQLQQRPAGARDASRRVIPNGKPSAAQISEAPEQMVSRAWIAEQNRLHSQGYYRRRLGEWQAVQETIDKAAREGRIR
jgi:hypothetical protein